MARSRPSAATRRDLLKMLEAARAAGGAGPGALGRRPGAGPGRVAPAGSAPAPAVGAGQPRALPGLRAPGRPEPRPARLAIGKGRRGLDEEGPLRAAAVPTADFPSRSDF